MLYRERLGAPVAWWLLAALLVVSCGAAVLFYVGPFWGVGMAVVTAVASVGLLVTASTVVVVTGEELRVGRAVLELSYVAGCRPLTAEETAARSGPAADARAYLVLRPYVATAVEVTLDDPADPVPYWLVSSRHPHRFAGAVRQALATRLGH